MKTLARIFRFIWASLDALRKALHLLLLLVTFGVIFYALSPHVPFVPSKAVLIIDPQGPLVEQTSGGPIDRAVAQASGRQQSETLLRDVVDAIETAKEDRRIQAIFLDLGNLTGGGVSKLEEVALALRHFRESGKLVIAAGDSFDQSQYYLAAQADEIYLDPQGMVFIEGYGYYRLFLKEAIDKLGVDVNVFRAGKFKSYTDQFSRNDMSAQEREESSAWLNSLWNAYQAAVTKARGLQPQALTEYVDQIVPALRDKAGDLAALSVERGLVNELKTRAQVEQRLMAITGENDSTHSYYNVHFNDYLETDRARRTLASAGEKRIGIVVASGEILDGTQPSGSIGGDSLAQLLREARFDDHIVAIVLRIDSPGGSVFASEIIRREIEALKQVGKPVIASMSSTAASGGYYIAMNADEIWASPTTLTGSIGVFAVLPTLEHTLAKFGVHSDGIGTTKLSGAFHLDRSMTAEQRDLLQLTVDHEYKQFVAHVAEARGKTPEQIDNVAQGRVWSGTDGKEQGLVDHLGSLQNAIEAAAKRAKLTTIKLEYIEPKESWRQTFANDIHILAARATRSIATEGMSLQTMMARLPPLDAELRRIARFTDPRQAYYYCVCTVQ